MTTDKNQPAYIFNPNRLSPPTREVHQNPRPVMLSPLERKQIMDKRAAEFETARQQKLQEEEKKQLEIFSPKVKHQAQYSQGSLVGAKFSTPMGAPAILSGHSNEQVWNAPPKTHPYFDEELSTVPFSDYEGSEIDLNDDHVEVTGFPEPESNFKRKEPELPAVGEACVIYNGQILKTCQKDDLAFFIIDFLKENPKVNLNDLIILQRLEFKYGLQ